MAAAVPISANRTRGQVRSDLEDLKCGVDPNQPSNMKQIDVVPVGRGRYNVQVHTPQAQVPSNQKNDMPRRKGRQMQTQSPYAQVYSWLRATNWDNKFPESGMDVLDWIDNDLSRQISPTLTNAERQQLPAAIQAFRDKISPTVGQPFHVFVQSLERGRGSSVTLNTAFMDHVCEWGQLTRAMKILYSQSMAITANIQAAHTLQACRPPKNASQKIRNSWGLFHRTYMPAIVYLRAWATHFGWRVLQLPGASRKFAPIFMLNLWAFYVFGALTYATKKQSQRQSLQYQGKHLTDMRTLLNPNTYHQYITTQLRNAPSGWIPEQQAPIMPGPLPESLGTSWAVHIRQLPQIWQRWLGTKSPRVRQYNIVNGRLSVTSGNDLEQSIMFRPHCTVQRRRVPRGATPNFIDLTVVYDRGSVPPPPRPLPAQPAAVVAIQGVERQVAGGLDEQDAGDLADIMEQVVPRANAQVPPGIPQQIANAVRGQNAPQRVLRLRSRVIGRPE